jgi:hypothetical protein
MAAAARGLNIAVLIVRHKSGHVQIMTDIQAHPWMKMNFAAFNRALLTAEFLTESKEHKLSDLKGENLLEPGACAKVKNWHWQVPGNNWLNGSETVTEQQPTCLSDAQLLDLVKNFLFRV